MDQSSPRTWHWLALWLSWVGLRWLAEIAAHLTGTTSALVDTAASALMVAGAWLAGSRLKRAVWWQLAVAAMTAWLASWTAAWLAGLADVPHAALSLPGSAGLALALAVTAGPPSRGERPATMLGTHFLRNAVHSVSALLPGRSEQAARAMDRLGEMLDQVLRTGGQEQVSLAQELSLVDNYLALERLRFGDRLHTKISAAPETYRMAVPSLCIQPLVENAVRHAVAEQIEGATVSVDVQLSGRFVVIRVMDDGKGTTLEQVTRSPGHGLRLLARRLKADGAHGAAMAIKAAPGHGFTATLRIPAAVYRKDSSDERFSTDSRR